MPTVPSRCRRHRLPVGPRPSPGRGSAAPPSLAISSSRSARSPPMPRYDSTQHNPPAAIAEVLLRTADGLRPEPIRPLPTDVRGAVEGYARRGTR